MVLIWSSFCFRMILMATFPLPSVSKKKLGERVGEVREGEEEEFPNLFFGDGVFGQLYFSKLTATQQLQDIVITHTLN